MSGGNNALKILIVEDNPGDAYLIMGLLQELGISHKITLAKDGRDAVSLLMKGLPNGPPDLVILDLNLPRINGYDVLNMIRASPALKEVPVVVMTGSLNPEDEVRSRSLGATDFCIKPGTNSEMERTMLCLRTHLDSVCRNKATRGGPRRSDAAFGSLLSRREMPYPFTMPDEQRPRPNDLLHEHPPHRV